jgi:hypothetical protein
VKRVNQYAVNAFNASVPFGLFSLHLKHIIYWPCVIFISYMISEIGPYINQPVKITSDWIDDMDL